MGAFKSLLGVQQEPSKVKLHGAKAVVDNVSSLEQAAVYEVLAPGTHTC